MPLEKYDVVIAGAGIVGMSVALWAQKSGLKVAICDPEPPGSGVTYGAACTIATYACVPINNPAILTSLPALLFAKDSPLSFDYLFGLKNMGWMLSFLANCRASKVEHISQSLGQLLRHTGEGLDPLIVESGAEDLFVQNDCLYVWSTAAGYESAKVGNEMRREQGVDYEVLKPDEILQLEPSLKMPMHRGLLFKGARHILDPQAFVMRMYNRFIELGGVAISSSVQKVLPNSDEVRVQLKEDRVLYADHFVVAAGAHSKSIKGSGAEALPLGVERGYHVTFKEHAGKVSRPVGWAEAGLYATPMALGLRIAGTVEINSVTAPLNPARINYLRDRATQMFGPLDGDQKNWHGCRPTMPDSLPVIGRSQCSARIINAFGHQHIGLTLAGVTGRLVTDIIQDKPPRWDLSCFTDKRF